MQSATPEPDAARQNPPADPIPVALAKLQNERVILRRYLQELTDQESYLTPRLQRITFERGVMEHRIAELDQQIDQHLHPLP
jgi:hypothetical protein